MSEGERTPPETEVDVELAIYALSAVFTALGWIDDKFLDDKVYPEQIKTARTHLILAGKAICERTAERF